MTGDPAKRAAAYENLCELPDNVVGEIVNGEIVATPRPSYRHGRAATVIAGKVGGPFDLGEGGPGGWWILVEPEIHLADHVLVPDLAGWRREKMPSIPEENWTDIPPDWVCEVISPNTARLDRVYKMPIYAAFRVPFIWMVDPANRTLDVFQLDSSGKWSLLASFAEDDKVRAEPFQEIEIALHNLWAD